MDEPAKDSWKGALRSYVLEHGDDLTFTGHFWKECEPIEKDIIQYWKFSSVLHLINKGLNSEAISERTEASVSTIYTWRKLIQLPKIAHYLKAYLELGEPCAGRRWLTTECSHGYG